MMLRSLPPFTLLTLPLHGVSNPNARHLSIDLSELFFFHFAYIVTLIEEKHERAHINDMILQPTNTALETNKIRPKSYSIFIFHGDNATSTMQITKDKDPAILNGEQGCVYEEVLSQTWF